MDNKTYFNNIAYKWDEVCNHSVDKINYVLKQLEIQPNTKILDIGSGTGVLIPHLEKAIGLSGYITALDISKNMMEISKQKNKYDNINFVVGDFYEFATDEKFDYIIAYSCYPHFKNKEKFFEKVYSLLKNNGKVIIAHVESKETINNRHSDIDDKLDSDKLLPVIHTSNLMNSFKINTIYSEDSENYYICIGQKNDSK